MVVVVVVVVDQPQGWGTRASKHHAYRNGRKRSVVASRKLDEGWVWREQLLL